MLKVGRRVRVIPNGLRASDREAGIADPMFKMQNKIYRIEKMGETIVELGGFWFSKKDVTERLEDIPQVYADNVLYNPDNLDL